MADQDSEKATKTVKGVSRDAWERAVKAADANDESFGDWLTTVLVERLARPADHIIPPSERLPDSLPEAPPTAQMNSETALVAIATAMGQLGGVKGTGGFAKRLRQAGEQHLEKLLVQPLPPMGRPPTRIRQTKLEIGQTEE